MMRTDQRRQYRLYLKVTDLLILPKGTSKLFKAGCQDSKRAGQVFKPTYAGVSGSLASMNIGSKVSENVGFMCCVYSKIFKHWIGLRGA